ncbi:carboxy-terminal kinesin 2-like isoform X1 [Limulus polyphemus]|uniref:Kinesin-like protein n=1 Tax=Limulus polyphemus TaxID=6850 RepID=A0ABM1B956_LIMPO|nr:carboxy-terminal kinesin 2-like isoform X1 [Limulus polyphemus]
MSEHSNDKPVPKPLATPNIGIPSTRIPSKIKPPKMNSLHPAVVHIQSKEPGNQDENAPSQAKRPKMDPPRYPPPLSKPAGTGLKRAHSALSLNVSTCSSTISVARGRSEKKAPLGPSVVNRVTTNVKASVPPAKSKKTKRPAWDLKGRIQDIEEQFLVSRKTNDELISQLKLNEERIALLEGLNSELSQDVQCKESKTQEANEVLEQLQKSLREKEEKLTTVRTRKESLENQVNTLQQECTGLQSTIGQLTSAQAGLQAHLEATKVILQQAQAENEAQKKMIQELQAKLYDKENKICVLETRTRQDEQTRRKLHNIIQELKGNIRVFCRVRPLLPNELDEIPEEHIPHIAFPDPDNREVQLMRLSDISLNESSVVGKTKTPVKYDFTFDRVFCPLSNQSEVFDEISQLVQSSLDGYNVCIFAYGQTGSGKTYTMEGPEELDLTLDLDSPCLGMIPRAVQQIFSTEQELQKKGWQYKMDSYFLEIYNEVIHDLLVDSPSDNSVKHEIKMVGKGSELYVTNLTTVIVKTEKRIHQLLKKARKNRAVAATKCNQHSSRSHSVFRIKLSGNNSITGETCEGTLNLVDLAGSERLKDSGSEGQRLEETKNINRSLANLGNVIMALSQKADHIPYRNSKLTHLLMNSLGGNSKVLMFVNVSPKEEHFNETLNSLRFATKVNQCQIGTAHKKVK